MPEAWYRCSAPQVAAVLFAVATCVDASAVCPLPWNANASLPDGVDLDVPCPYGESFIIRKFQVTIPNNAGVLEYICVLYGIIPFAIIALSAMNSIMVWCYFKTIGTRDLSFYLFVSWITLLNELVFKRIVKEPRPEKSCGFTCGFPSGHSTMAMGFFTLVFLDGLYRLRPKLPMTEEHAKMMAKSLHENPSLGWIEAEHVRGHQVWAMTVEFILGPLFGKIVPLSVDDTMDSFDFGVYLFSWGIYLLPVPVSRVVLHDHTPKQVMAGCAIGMFEAVLWFLMVRKMQRKKNHMLSTRFWGCFNHNYALPRFEVYSRGLCWVEHCQLCLEDYEAIEAGEARQSMKQPINPVQTSELLEDCGRLLYELDWYLRHTGAQHNTFHHDKIFHDNETAAFRALLVTLKEMNVTLLDGNEPEQVLEAPKVQINGKTLRGGPAEEPCDEQLGSEVELVTSLRRSSGEANNG